MQTGPGRVTVVVKPVTALTGTASIAVTLSALPGGLVVAPVSGTTLNTTTQAAGLQYTVSVASGCAGVTKGGTPVFNFLANPSLTANPGTGAVTDVGLTVTTGLTSTFVLALTPSTISVPNSTCAIGSAPPSSTVTVKPWIPLTLNQTITVALPTLTGGLSVSPTATGSILNNTNQSSGLVYTVTFPTGCAGVTEGFNASFAFKAANVADSTLTVTTHLSSTYALVVSPPAITPTCSTQTGPTITTVTVKPTIPLTSGTIAVTLPGTLLKGLIVTPPTVATLSSSNQAQGLQYAVTFPTGCVGVTSDGDERANQQHIRPGGFHRFGNLELHPLRRNLYTRCGPKHHVDVHRRGWNTLYCCRGRPSGWNLRELHYRRHGGKRGR
jgi:hypothetical protein